MTSKSDFLRISINDEFPQEDLAAKLKSIGYVQTDFVSRPGEFTFRGMLMDIFPLTYKYPLRIVFELDYIKEIKSFSPLNAKLMSSFENVRIIPVNKIFESKISKYERELYTKESFDTISNLKRGDYVVHLKYGISKYLGSKELVIGRERKRHIALEFQNKEILYLDPSEVRFLERYIGLKGKSPSLSKLNSKEWIKIKEKTRIAIKNIAQDLLSIQAKRSLLKGMKCEPDGEWMRNFEDEFPFNETPDQIQSWKEVKLDMESEKPMDRLICGDVGYGKTEVAMRSAFKAVMNQRQVAFLVPTTILAEQHSLTLSKRVRSFPVRVEALSRFKSKSEQKRIVEDLNSGLVDIVIGTHRLLSSDIHFKNLGLVIIDEEQRFGVKHKEKLKHLRSLVDVLTLTATPIPRTLYLSLVGAKDMSTINTPPSSRLPVHTEIIHFDENKIKNVINEELKRKGQIYFVHNRVESIEMIYHRLKTLLPGVRFAVAHGQMQPKVLEKVMDQFIKGEVDCMISTNIIESGLDIPNANTIIVNRADTFGLSDLYQLRGRVGRFKEQRKAYAYFIAPKNWRMTEDAEKRIAAIEKFSELGSGFKIAMEDMEIRGVGNVLGIEQSGFIYQVGFDLYCKLLQGEIEEEKKKLKMK